MYETSFKRMGENGADLSKFENEECVRLKGKGTVHKYCTLVGNVVSQRVVG